MDQSNQTQAAPPQMFQLIVSGEEAGLILNKLNTASFTGFKEASMATTLFAKIQSAQRIGPQPTAGSAPIAPPVPPVTPITPTQETKPDASTFTAPPNVEGNEHEKTVDASIDGDSIIDDDNRPGAPLTSLADVRGNKEALAEDETTSVPSAEDDSIFSVVNKATKASGVKVGESDI